MSEYPKNLPRRFWTRHPDAIIREVEVVNAEDYDALRSRVAELEGDLSVARLQLGARICTECPAKERVAKEERAHSVTMDERDQYHEMADKLADAIAAHFGEDIGEHSNLNCPWTQALELIESRASASAGTSL